MKNLPWHQHLNLNTDTNWQVKTITNIFLNIMSNFNMHVFLIFSFFICCMLCLFNNNVFVDCDIPSGFPLPPPLLKPQKLSLQGTKP